MSDQVIFMIEGGKALELVKKHVAEIRRARNEAMSLIKDLGVERCRVSDVEGIVISVDFGDRPRHPDFKMPGKHGAYPKKGTAWWERFKNQKGHDSGSEVVANAFEVPLEISYSRNGAEGWRHIGTPLRECGFLYLNESKGPYAMWMPDVPAEVAATQEKGYTVEEPAASFKMEFDGCRRIDLEEWELLVAQYNLSKKRAERAAEKKA